MRLDPLYLRAPYITQKQKEIANLPAPYPKKFLPSRYTPFYLLPVDRTVDASKLVEESTSHGQVVTTPIHGNVT